MLLTGISSRPTVEAVAGWFAKSLLAGGGMHAGICFLARGVISCIRGSRKFGFMLLAGFFRLVKVLQFFAFDAVTQASFDCGNFGMIFIGGKG